MSSSKNCEEVINVELELDNDEEYQEWAAERRKEKKEHMMQFYDLWETEEESCLQMFIKQKYE